MTSPTATNDGQRPRRGLRSAGAVLAGFLAVVALSLATDMVMHLVGFFPAIGEPMSDAHFGVALAYRLVYGVVGGYVAARLAPDRPMRHALVLGVVGLVVSGAGAFATWGQGPAFGPAWYPLSLVATALPCAWAGGWLRTTQAGERIG